MTNIINDDESNASLVREIIGDDFGNLPPPPLQVFMRKGFQAKIEKKT